MLALLTLFRVVRDVLRDVGRRVEADRAVDFHEFYSSDQIEPKEQPEHYVMLLQKKKADQFTSGRTRGSKELNAQVLLLFDGDFGLDCHHVRNDRIVGFSLVKLW